MGAVGKLIGKGELPIKSVKSSKGAHPGPKHSTQTPIFHVQAWTKTKGRELMRFNKESIYGTMQMNAGSPGRMLKLPWLCRTYTVYLLVDY